MNGINVVTCIGNISADSQLTFLEKNTVAKFSVGVNEKFKKKDGTVQDSPTEWFNVVFWGSGAQALNPYLKKGALVYVSGKQKTESWEKDGVKHYKTTLVANTITLLGSKPAGQNGNVSAAPASQEVNGNVDNASKAQAQNYAKSEPAMVDGNSSFNDDTDLPF